jgi:hypothetical protein
MVTMRRFATTSCLGFVATQNLRAPGYGRCALPLSPKETPFPYTSVQRLVYPTRDSHLHGYCALTMRA